VASRVGDRDSGLGQVIPENRCTTVHATDARADYYYGQPGHCGCETALNHMQPDATPVLLVVAGPDLSNVPTVIASFQRHSEFRTFILVCPGNVITRALDTGGLQNCTIEVVDEKSVIPGLSASVVARHIPAHLPGRQSGHWYYQQFLKMAFSRFAAKYPFYLIWDADTVLARPIRFFERGAVLLTASHEWHKDYFRTLARILPDVRIPGRSYISQHLLVYREHMLALLDELSSHGMPWWQYVLSSLAGRTPQQFSEYETYAAYCLTRWPNCYRSIWRRWLRHGRSYFGQELKFADVSLIGDLFDFVAFEDWDRGPRSRVMRRVLRERIAVYAERRIGWRWFPKP
jgi:Family of unknown function (DUF6492)